MEQHVAELELLRDGLLDQLNDPDLPFLDRQIAVQEMERLTREILDLEMIIVFENAWWAEEDDDMSTLSLESSETIGEDEYEEDRLIMNDDFDLGGEI
jgi:hypothetical protein